MECDSVHGRVEEKIKKQEISNACSNEMIVETPEVCDNVIM